MKQKHRKTKKNKFSNTIKRRKNIQKGGNIFSPNNDEIRIALTNLSYGNKDYGQIEGWDTSNVTNMDDLFKDIPDFNENIND